MAFRVMVFAIILYFAAALAGFVTSGAAPKFRLFPPRGLSDIRYNGPLGGVLSTAVRLLIAFNMVLLATVFFVFSSPLFALRFFNDLTGRQPPHGAVARWYIYLVERLQSRPNRCSTR